jgi:hypothetical protein
MEYAPLAGALEISAKTGATRLNRGRLIRFFNQTPRRFLYWSGAVGCNRAAYYTVLSIPCGAIRCAIDALPNAPYGLENRRVVNMKRKTIELPVNQKFMKHSG